MEFTQELINQAIYRIDENTDKLEKCFVEMTEEEIWKRPNSSSNSVGNLILHLCGNITQYIISSLGEQEDKRTRDAEFATKEGYSKQELRARLIETTEQAKGVLKQQQASKMLLKRSVQGYQFSAIGIIMHVVEHYSYHTGQIAFWLKLLKDKDLGFYANLDLNQKNEF